MHFDFSLHEISLHHGRRYLSCHYASRTIVLFIFCHFVYLKRIIHIQVFLQPLLSYLLELYSLRSYPIRKQRNMMHKAIDYDVLQCSENI